MVTRAACAQAIASQWNRWTGRRREVTRQDVFFYPRAFHAAPFGPEQKRVNLS